MAQGEPLSIPDFALKIKTKYPEYKDIEDTVLVEKILKKYPDYAESVDVSGLKKKEPSVPVSPQSGTTSSPIQSPLQEDPNDIFGRVRKVKELEGMTQQIPMPSSGKGGNITVQSPDIKARDEANLQKERLKQEGYDADSLFESIRDVPDELYKIPGFTQQELLSDSKENPQLFERKLATGKWQLNLKTELDKQALEGNISPEEHDQVWNAVQNYQNNSDVGDYAQQRRNVQDVVRIINQYGGKDKEKLLQAVAIDRSKNYGGAFLHNMEEGNKSDPNSKFLDNDQLLAYQYLQDTNPDKAAAFSAVLIDPTKIKKGAPSEAGWQAKMLQLKELGIGLQQTYVQEQLNDLERIYNQNGGQLPPNLQKKAEELTLKQEQLSEDKTNAVSQYWNPGYYDRISAVQEILGQKNTGLNYLTTKTGQSVANTISGLRDFAYENLASEENKKLYQLEAMGESMQDEAMTYVTQKNSALKNFELRVSPQLQKQIDEIKNDSNLDDTQKYDKTYNLLRDNPGDWGRVPINGGKVNINPSSLFYSISDLTATLVPFMAMETVTGGGATAGVGRKFLSTFTSAAATGFHEAYTTALKEGEANPFSHALRVTAINSAALAGAGTPQAIREMLGTKTAIGELVNRMSDDAINAALKESPSAIKNFGKAALQSFGKATKEGAKISAFTTGGEIANTLISGKDIDPEMLAKQALVSTLTFSLGGGLAGMKSRFDKISNLQSDALVRAAQEPELFTEVARKQYESGALNPEQYNNIVSNIQKAGEVAKGLKFVDDNGKPLSPANSAKLLMLKMQEAELKENSTGVSETLKEKNNEKLEELQTEINETYKNKDAAVEPPREVPQAIGIKKQVEKPVGTEDKDVSLLTKDAEDLLSSIGEGSKPTFITKNLERIAKENGIEVTDKMSADDVINALKEKQQSGKDIPAIDKFNIYDQNSELKSIGTDKEYSDYTSEIFPESKIQDVVYHGTKKEFDKFERKENRNRTRKDKNTEIDTEGFHFVESKAKDSYATIYGEMKPVVLDIKNPISTKYETTEGSIAQKLEYLSKENIDEFKKQGYDSGIIERDSGNEYIVFDPEQIHILGGKSDVENFKTWKNDKIYEITEENIHKKSDEELRERLKYLISRDKKNVGGKEPFGPVIKEKEAKRISKELEERYGIQSVFKDLNKKTLRGTYSHSKMLISINTNTNLGLGNFRRRTIFHEYLHPFVDILENYNKRLFISMAKKARELNKTENFFPKEIKREYEYGTHNQEAIVRLLEKFSDSDVPQSLVKKFFNWLTGFFYSKRKNNKADIKKLSRDTTPEELYNIFKNYGLLKDEAATAPIQLRIKEEIKTLEDFINGKFTEKLTPEQTIDAKEQLRKLKKKLRSLDLYRKSEIDLIREELIKRGIDISKLGIEDTEITSGQIPPPETTDPITIHIDDKRTVLSHRGLQEIATQFGMDDITSRDRKSDLRLLKDAETTINKWVESGDYAKNVESLIKDAENSRVLNDEQRIILEQHIANVRKQAEVIKAEKGINSPEFDEKLRELKRLSDAGAKTRSEAGAALRLPNSSSQPLASLENAMVAKMEANGVDVLTEKQKAEVETQFAEYEKKMADMKAKLEEVTQKKTELEAQLRLQEEVRKSGGRNVKRDYKAERKSLKEQLAEEAKKFLAEGQKMGIASDGGTEQFKISAKMAGIIWDIAKSHVQETGANLAEVTKRVFEDIKALVPGITERDVQDVIAGKYVEKKKTRNDLAAQMRQLRIEQQLLNEYDKLLNGGEPKDEERKVARNARLAELSKKIKDLVNPPKEKEGEPKTSEEKKLENIIKANKKKQQEIEQRIKDKDFEDKPKPKSWVDDPEFRKRNPELYKEAIKSIQEREEAKDRFNLALHQDLLSKRSKLKKAFDFASKLISTSKAIKAGIDDSVTFVQLGLTVMANPKKGLEAKIEAFKNTNAARFKRELTALRQSPLWEYIEKGGLDITEPKSEAKEKQEELYSGNLLDRNMKLFGGKNPWTYTGGIFERWFTTMGNSLRSSLYKAKVEEMLAEGKTLENDLEEFQSVARVLNEMTGRGKVNEHLEKAMPVITPIIWAPKMLASSFNILGMGDLVNAPFGKKGFYRSLTPEQRKYAAYQIGRGIGVGVSVMSALAIAGWDVDADPESVGFGSVTTPDGNKSYNVFGRYANTVKVIYQSMSGKRTIKDGFTTDLDEKGGRAGIVGKFFRGKMTPFAGLAYDYWLNSQKNSFTRQPITLGSLPGDLLTPISINEMKKGFEQDGAPSLLTRFLPAFEGLQVQDKRDYPDLSNLSEDSKNVLKEKGLDIPTTKKQKPLTIKNPEEGTKREATTEEMERYTKRKRELMDEKIKGINDAEIGLDKYGDITLNPEKTIETISGSKLTKEQVKKLISLYSTQSAKEARTEVFGNDDDD